MVTMLAYHAQKIHNTNMWIPYKNAKSIFKLIPVITVNHKINEVRMQHTTEERSVMGGGSRGRVTGRGEERKDKEKDTNTSNRGDERRPGELVHHEVGVIHIGLIGQDEEGKNYCRFSSLLY